MQIEAGIDALIIGGTTGEAATLSDEERYQLYTYAKDVIGGRAPLIFGTGTNDTYRARRLTKMASRIGCDGVLVVTPYYNKGTDEGIIRHFLTIAEESTAPVLLYNVPSRTGVNLKTEVLERLSEHENIVGIKEAHDSMDRLMELSALGERLPLYAGNDSAFFGVLSLGGHGVISVISNAYPKEMKRVYELFCGGDRQGALNEQIRLLPLIKSAFIETNPSPIKYIMSKMGLVENELRLPLAPVTIQSARVIDEIIKNKRG